MQVTIYHNPRCSKSRQTLELLHSQGIRPVVVHYLQTPPDVSVLRTLLQKLGFTSARQLMRSKEALYNSLNLHDDGLDEEQLLQTLAENPHLIERPIVIKGEQARLGRPPEQVLEIL